MKKLLYSSKTVNRGLYLALATAFISGVSIFVNGLAVKTAGPYIFTTAKNLLVAVWLMALLIGLRQLKLIRRLALKEWLALFIIGLIGGSIPFLLFFKGLALAGPAAGAFIHKTLFIWVAVLALIFLKEKLTVWTTAGLFLLVGGNFLLLKIPGAFWGKGQLLIWLSVACWALESIFVKYIFTHAKNLSSPVMASARMFFGSLIMLIYLVFSHQLHGLLTLSVSQLWWIVGTAVFLFGYVLMWYGAIRWAPVHIVSAVLVLGSPLTTLLSALFIRHQLSLRQLAALTVFALAAYFFIRAGRLVASSAQLMKYKKIKTT